MYLLISLLFIPAIYCENKLFNAIIVPAGCVIPRDADNIVRAALLQQCISPSKGKSIQEERCFGELGCFPMKSPWTSNLRPFPQPMTPDEIQPQLYFYSRDSPKAGQLVKIWPNISMEGIKYDVRRPYTTFMTHGFASQHNTSWLLNMKDNYLKERDANVFITDWNLGANRINYLQVASNTRIVGAAVARFVKYLKEEKGLKPSQIHLIGHSLGSHISSYVSKTNPSPRIAVLTALDPAQPGFEGSDASVRLDKSDADHVEVVHTSGRPFIPLLGFGFITTVGHSDFYFNGGALQPKCKLPSLDSVSIKSISDLALVPVEVLSEWVGCSHNLAHEYYSEAILTQGHNNCSFVARKTGVVEHLTNTFSAGYSNKLASPVLSRFVDCKAETCSIFGLEINKFPASGKFTVNTNADSPFCQIEIDRQKKLEKSNDEREQLKKLEDSPPVPKTLVSEAASPSLSPSLSPSSPSSPSASTQSSTTKLASEITPPTTTSRSILNPVRNVFNKVKSLI